jgi:hypothetical protein
VKIGVLVTGDTAVRAAHSLAAHPGIDEVVVIGPATSKTYQVVDNADGCDLILGHGPTAPGRARDLGVPLLWDGETPEPGVAVYGASPQGLALAVAAREPDPQLVAVAHPTLKGGNDHRARFPYPIGRVTVGDSMYGGKRVAEAKSPNEFAAVLTVGAARRVTIVDDGEFLSGISLAAGAAIVGDEPAPVWDTALDYLQAAADMGLVMAEES